MVLIMLTDPSDPISALWCSAENILVGTISGSVKLFFRNSPNESEPWLGVVLCKRSAEGVMGLLMNDNSEAFAVIGDVSILRWDLKTLEYDKPIIKGCRHNQVDFAIKHTFNQCPQSTTFLHYADNEEPRILVIRPDGECCCTDLNRCQQRLMDEVGPLPEEDTKLQAYAFDGKRVVYVTKRYGGRTDLRLFSIWEGSQDLRKNQQLAVRNGQLRGVQFVDQEFIAVLQGWRKMFFWCIKTNTLIPLQRCPDILIFQVVKLPSEDGRTPRILIISVSRRGMISVGECFGVTDNSKAARFLTLHLTRKQTVPARFHLSLPYSIKCCIKRDTSPIILYNDDRGLHLEIGLFEL